MTAMSLDPDIDVHRGHCCARWHGCKYGEEDCPVALKKVKPLYACWECDDDRKELVARLKALSPSEQVDIFRDVFF